MLKEIERNKGARGTAVPFHDDTAPGGQPYQNPTDNIMLPVETGELSIRIDTLSYELCIRIQSLPGNPQWSHDVTIVNPKLEELEISNIHSTIYTIGNSTMLVLNGICE